ncbi:MAG: S8 family peptidase [Parerythrobacter sp.]
MPTPTPTPTSGGTNFNTSEFRRSDGPDFHNAVTAWRSGITGAGATIAIIDTGIDSDSPEFAGRLHPDSRDVAGNGTVEAEDDHGTNVALIAAAARDNTGVVGIAYDATILALRADRPGTCATETDATLDGCLFSGRAIAEGIDQAVSSGARVVNLSLGGGEASRSTISAIEQAREAGLVIIVSAGNDGDVDDDPDIDPNQPDQFAADVLQAGGDSVIIVGSVDDDGIISGFSNRAGSLSASYLTARGERICCTYEDGEVRITTRDDGGRFVTLFSGTSFSAPQVTGAVALLAQAFPNLTGEQIVEILLDSARDAGEAGSDAIYGRGILDIARALQPAGATTLAGSTVAVALTGVGGTGSASMGGALTHVPLDTVITDKYGRAYNFDLGSRLRSGAVRQRLHGAVSSGTRQVSAGGPGVALAFTIDASGSREMAPLSLSPDNVEQARVLAGRVAARFSPDTQLALGFATSGDSLSAQLQGRSQPAFMVASDASGDMGMTSRSDAAIAARHRLGAWGLTASASTGNALVQQFRTGTDLEIDTTRDGLAVKTFSLTADRRFGGLDASAGLTLLDEKRTILGAAFDTGFGARGARSIFIDAQWSAKLFARWRMGGAMRYGRTVAAQTGVVGAGSSFDTAAWSIDVDRAGVFQQADSIGFRMSQPLRVESGGLLFDLPIAYDYATESAVYGTRALPLSPDGREIMGEVTWRGTVLGGDAQASAYLRREPGHYSTAQDDMGLALRWSRTF